MNGMMILSGLIHFVGFLLGLIVFLTSKNMTFDCLVG